MVLGNVPDPMCKSKDSRQFKSITHFYNNKESLYRTAPNLHFIFLWVSLLFQLFSKKKAKKKLRIFCFGRLSRRVRKRLASAFDDPRVTLRLQDGAQWVAQAAQGGRKTLGLEAVGSRREHEKQYKEM